MPAVGLGSERIPNEPLTGPDLKKFLLWRIEQAMNNQWVFNPGTSYPAVAFEAEIRLQFKNPNLQPLTIAAKNTADSGLESPLPLKDSEDTGIRAFKIEEQVTNPNVSRIHAGIPISIASVTPPKPGELVPKVEVHAVTYAKDDAPELPDPKLTDLSPQVAAKFGIKPAVPSAPPRRAKGAVKYDPKDAADDAEIAGPTEDA